MTKTNLMALNERLFNELDKLDAVDRRGGRVVGYNVVSLSGGKDSTAMLLMMIERGIKVDEAVFFDTGWEFPQMYEHLDKLEQVSGVNITRLHPKIPFTEIMLHNHRTRGKRVDCDAGMGWPFPRGRWCTSRKTLTIEQHLRSRRPYVQYIGIAADEAERAYDKDGNRKPNEYPLIDWGVTEADALEYCKARGFDWGGLYDHFNRVSCFCCPLQSISELRKLRRFYPELWMKMLEWDFYINRPQDRPQDRFREDYDLPELEMRFRAEDRQLRLF